MPNVAVVLASIRAKAEKGDAQAQFKLASAFIDGTLGLLLSHWH
jgi:hypothetical protein